ncbi:MAG: trehalose-phosphatase [Miltoncostaeaceae bacterium]
MTPGDQNVVERLARHLDDLAVLTDLDGTLAAIRPRPEDVTIVEGARGGIGALAARAALVAVVSGRGIDDLIKIVGVPEISYVGNHGMEFRRPGQDPAPDPAAARHRPAIEEFMERWRPGLGERDIEIEDKGVTLSLHYRRSRFPAEAAVFLEETVAPAAGGAGLVPTPGRKILEIRPPVRLDKGTAARSLVAESGARRALFMGDDHTDLDASRALRAMCEEGALAEAVSVGVDGDEVPREVVDDADLVVDGPEGALGVLLALGRGAPARGTPEE